MTKAAAKTAPKATDPKLAEEAKADHAAKAKPADTTTTKAPDVHATAKKSEGLRQKITELQGDLAKAEAQEAHAAAAENLANLQKAHKDADGDHYQQKMLQQQIDQHTPQVEALKAAADAHTMAEPGNATREAV